MMMDVSLENFHIYILISRHATDTDMGPILSSLSLSELLPNMLIKEELQGSAHSSDFCSLVKNGKYYLSFNSEYKTLIFVLYLFRGETLPF